jgi:thiosulfate/3-mercaptopyruvate sulfurtransferase
MFVSRFRCSLRPLPSLSSSLKPIATLGSKRAMSTKFELDSYLVTPSELDTVLKKNVHSKLSTAPRVYANRSLCPVL